MIQGVERWASFGGSEFAQQAVGVLWWLGVSGSRLGWWGMDYGFPGWFFNRADEFDDRVFYEPARMVTHIDDAAIAAVGVLYDELEIGGRVLDLMGSWISHFTTAPSELVVLGMNRAELHANPGAESVLVHDLNVTPALPFLDSYFDHVVCAVSVDYLIRPIEVFAEVARVLQPGGRFICTFSNRCFPTKAIQGWLMATEAQRCDIVAKYFVLAGGFQPAIIENRTETTGGDPLYAVHAVRTSSEVAHYPTSSPGGSELAQQAAGELA